MQTRKPLVESPNGSVDLSNEEIARYSRHLIMPEVALEGQKQLKQARVLTIGAGGLGSPLAMYLAAAGIGTFYVAVAIYSAIVQPDAEQTVAQDLGAEQGTAGLIAAGFMVVCVAPVAEEFFFRGFFYRALRSRYAVITAAAIDGLLFGVIHYDFSGADALLFVPPLAALGFLFCLIYERTGSLYPVIAIHALNNAIAFGVTVEAVWPSIVFGTLVLLGCAAVPRAQRAAVA